MKQYLHGRKKRRRKTDKDEIQAKLPRISRYFIYSDSAPNEVTAPLTPIDECGIATPMPFCPRTTIAGTRMAPFAT